MQRERAQVLPKVAISACCLVLSTCVVGKHSLKKPGGEDAVIILGSTRMPEPIDSIAVHAWFAVREKGSSDYYRIEYGGIPDGQDVVHAVWRGETAERGIRCLEANKDDAEVMDYIPYPGPNSNTFVDILLRKCGLRADLPATAIGKDYRGRFIGASWTSGGTGFQVETPLLGFRLGLTEGIEVHLLTFAFGVDLWPPALIIPFGPGRIGFADR